MTKKLYLDMDGVLVDFDTEFARRFGMSPMELREGKAEDFWEVFNRNPHKFYEAAPAYPGVKGFVKAVERQAEAYGYVVEILTAVPRMATYPTAATEKRTWLAAHGLGHLPFNIGPHSQDKQFHCKPGDILIDDNSKNIVQWRAKEGYGIFHFHGADFNDTLDFAIYCMSQEEELANDPGF